MRKRCRWKLHVDVSWFQFALVPFSRLITLKSKSWRNCFHSLSCLFWRKATYVWHWCIWCCTLLDSLFFFIGGQAYICILNWSPIWDIDQTVLIILDLLIQQLLLFDKDISSIVELKWWVSSLSSVSDKSSLIIWDCSSFSVFCLSI